MTHSVNKIIFLMDNPCSKRLFEQCGIETLTGCGYSVKIWDITQVIHPEIFDKIYVDEPVHSERCIPYDNRQNLVDALSEISSDTIVNCFVGYRYETHFIFRELSRNEIKFCVPQMITFPLPPNHNPRRSLRLWNLPASFFRKIVSIKPRHIIADILTKILQNHYSLFGIKPATMTLLTGEKSFEFKRDPVGDSTIKVWAHALDYDVYIRQKEKNCPTDPTLCVYIDEYFPLHSDLAYLDTPCPVPTEEYYAKLRNFFDYVEKKNNVRIVIAAHPKSDYLQQPDYFAGRSIIKGRTAELIQESSFVLTHMSTAVNFAVLFRKPIIFMTMDRFEEAREGRLVIGPYINSIAHALNTRPVNIDHFEGFDLMGGIQVDIPSYVRYQNDFIKKEGSPDKIFWEIYSLFLKKSDMEK